MADAPFDPNELNADEAAAKVRDGDFTTEELEAVLAAEEGGKNRVTVKDAVASALADVEPAEDEAEEEPVEDEAVAADLALGSDVLVSMGGQQHEATLVDVKSGAVVRLKDGQDTEVFVAMDDVEANE